MVQRLQAHSSYKYSNVSAGARSNTWKLALYDYIDSNTLTMGRIKDLEYVIETLNTFMNV